MSLQRPTKPYSPTDGRRSELADANGPVQSLITFPFPVRFPLSFLPLLEDNAVVGTVYHTEVC